MLANNIKKKSQVYVSQLQQENGEMNKWRQFQEIVIQDRIINYVNASNNHIKPN